MSDNTRLPIGTEDGDTYASDDISGVKFQRVKLALGADGTNNGDVSSSNPLPVSDNGGSLTVDGPLTDTQLRASSVDVNITGGASAGTEYTEDAAAAANPVGGMLIVRRKDTLSATEVSADGDNIALNATNKGQLHVKLADTVTVDASGVAVPVTDNGGNLSIDDGGNTITVDNGGTFAVQASIAAAQTLATVTTVGTVTTITNVVHVDDNSSTLSIDDGAGNISIDDGGNNISIDDGGNTITVDQATGTNLHTVVDSGTITTITNVVHVDDNSSTLSIDDGGGNISIDDGGNSITIDGSVTDSQTAATMPSATTMQNAATATGNGTSLNVLGYASALLDINITGSATIAFEASTDDSTWNALLGSRTGSYTTAASTSVASTTTYSFNVAGFKSLRARISVYGSGNVTVKGYPTPLSGPDPFVTTISNAGTSGGVTLDAETTKVIGTVNVAASQTIAVTNAGTFAVQATCLDSPDATSTYAPTNATTTVYATNLVVKASAGVLFSLTGFNSKTSSQFIQIHDAASLPSEAAVPKIMFIVTASSNFSIDFGGKFGRYFSTGITICNSSTGPTKTIGAADCWWDVQYK